MSGGDVPDRSRRRTALAVGLAAVLVLAALVTQHDEPAPPPHDLRWVETGGGPSVAWGYGGRLEVSLPLLLHNDGPPVTIGSAAIARSSLVHPAVDVALARGGRLPVTLQRSMDCPDSAQVPRDAVLWLTVRGHGPPERHRLPLPPPSEEALRGALAQACREVPLSQAVVLSSRSSPQDRAVVLHVHARNVREDGVRLRSVAAATGLRVAVVPDADAPATVPVELGKQPLVLRLRVQVHDCAVLGPTDSAGRVAVADVAYEDGPGAGAVKAVLDESGAVHDLVDAAC